MAENPVEWLEDLYDQVVERFPRADTVEENVELGTWRSSQFWNKYRRENRIPTTCYTQTRERRDDPEEDSLG